MSGTVRIKGDQLVFEIHGIDEILAMKRTLSVPLEHVVSVSTADIGWNPFQQLRLVGASQPGLIKDGSYLTGNGEIFMEMHHPEKCITVNLDHETYHKIVFEVEDKMAAAHLIEDALARKQAPSFRTRFRRQEQKSLS